MDPDNNKTQHRVKYPRTLHLPWSPGVSDDDCIAYDLGQLDGEDVVISEKMDGENTSLYRDGLHARSLSGSMHPSRSWVRAFHSALAHDIPERWRICGENLYASHSIYYENLPSYFLAFSVWDEHNICLSWDETTEICGMLGIHLVPTIYRGVWNEGLCRALRFNEDASEGYVVRLARRFTMDEFPRSVLKYVRARHVQTDEHWMHTAVRPNRLKV